MALLFSENDLVGMKCPPFKLQSVDDHTYSLGDFKDARVLLVAFICNHCPYVEAIENRLIALAHEFSSQSVQTIAICSNDASGYPDDSKENLYARWQEKKYGFPYLLDQDQSVARSFKAVCTPEFYLFDEHRILYYHGRLDDAWKDEHAVKNRDLADAIQALLSSKAAPAVQHPSQGCSIKWRT